MSSETELHAKFKDYPKQKILITGASGLVGGALALFLSESGQIVTKLSRGPQWDPEKNILDVQILEDHDAIIHLSGENVASGRWSQQKKKKIYESRINSTRLLVSKLKRVAVKPKTFICASAVGFYGDTGNQIATENSGPGSGFLADVVKAWEVEALQAESSGIRTVCTRFGMILSKQGGALGKMLPAFKLGLGGPLGSGTQYISWISLHDVVGIIVHALYNQNLSGPINVVSPEPCTSNYFSETLASVLHRPHFFRVPQFALELALGEMGREVLLASSRVLPEKLTASGYKFLNPTLEEAFKSEIF